MGTKKPIALTPTQQAIVDKLRATSEASRTLGTDPTDNQEFY
jgi:hypothetical protein